MNMYAYVCKPKHWSEVTLMSALDRHILLWCCEFAPSLLLSGVGEVSVGLCGFSGGEHLHSSDSGNLLRDKPLAVDG